MVVRPLFITSKTKLTTSFIHNLLVDEVDYGTVWGWSIVSGICVWMGLASGIRIGGFLWYVGGINVMVLSG